jgi:hypothetical protein
MGHARWIALLTVCLLAPAASAQEQALLLDRSGSMARYYSNGLVGELRQKITAALDGRGKTRLLAFSDRVEPVANPAAITTGGSTYLNRAIEYVIQNKYDVAWVVTDNIQSTPGAQEGDTEAFYSVLRGPSVKRVIIFPVPQPPGTDTPGIAVYALLLSPGAARPYEDGVAAFARGGRDGRFRTETLRMKPLDRDTVDISVVGSSLDRRSGKPYEVGQTIRETMEVRFKSRFDYLKVIDAEIAVPRIEADFGPESVLKPDRMKLDITPRIVRVLDPLDETREIYKIEADLGTINLKKDFSSLWRAAFGRSKEKHTLHLAFLINVPQRNFKLKESFVEAYNADTPSAAKSTGKVYGIEHLPSLLTEDVTPIWAEAQIPVTVKYPWWPSVLFILCFLGLMVGLVSAARLAGRGLSAALGGRRWGARAETDYGAEITCAVDGGEVFVQSSAVGRIRRNSFYPGEGVSLLEPEGESVALDDGTRVRLRTRKGETSRLTFSRAKTSQEKDGDGYAPRRRR